MLLAAVRNFFERHNIGDERIIAAVSGGSDSTALLLALSEIGREIVCIHINHHLRGAQSDADEQFVRQLCERLNVPLTVCDGTIDPESIRRSGLEAAARDVRIARLQEVRAGRGFIATAHQKNDQAETIVMRLLTGTGLAGLRGIHEVREDGFIRPLIDVTRGEINAFLAERGITARVDEMNSDERFLRNRVRAALRGFGTGAIDNIAAVATQAQQLWPLVEQAIDLHESQHVAVTRDEARFTSWPEDPWMRRALLQRHIRRLEPHSRDVSAKDLERLESSIDSIQRVSVTKSLELIRRNGALVLRTVPRPVEPFEVTVTIGERAFIPEINAEVTIAPATRSRGNPETRKRGEPATRFVVRNRRPGDRFRDKKLKDLLIDRKIAAEMRDRLPLVVWNGEIVWVAGIEDSGQFKVTSPEGELFEVVLEHESRKSEIEVQR